MSGVSRCECRRMSTFVSDELKYHFTGLPFDHMIISGIGTVSRCWSLSPTSWRPSRTHIIRCARLTLMALMVAKANRSVFFSRLAVHLPYCPASGVPNYLLVSKTTNLLPLEPSMPRRPCAAQGTRHRQLSAQQPRNRGTFFPGNQLQEDHNLNF